MGKKFVSRTFIYFLCISFLLLTNGFHSTVAEATEFDRPIGEMFSNGEVKFESRKNLWKNVEPSHFPIFQGIKIRTEKGKSVVTLSNDSQIEVGQNGLLSFARSDQIQLIQGTINIRFPSTAGLNVNIGNLKVMRYPSLHASKNPSAVEGNGETIGCISVYPNGSVTVKSIRGSLSVVNQEHVVLAALSSKETVTIPSVTVNSPSKVMVVQVGETGPGSSSEGEFLGLSTETWARLAFGAEVAALVAGGFIYYYSKHHHHRGVVLLCP